MADKLNNEAIIPDKPKFKENLSQERGRLIKILGDTLRKQGISENELPRQQLDRNILLVIARGIGQYFWFCYWAEDKGGYDAFDQDDFEALRKCNEDTPDEEVSHVINLPYEKNLYSEKVDFKWIIGTNYTQAAVERFIVSRLLERLGLLESNDGTHLAVQKQRLQTLLEKYEITSPDKLEQMTELDLLNEFVIPLFQSLGWSVERPATFQKSVGVSDLTLLSENKDIRIPVEVKRLRQSLNSAVEQIIYYADPDGEWAIATNFEMIQVLDTQIRQIVWTLQDPKIYLVSSDLQALTPDGVRSGSLRRVAELARTPQQLTGDEVQQSQDGTETHTASHVIDAVLSDENQQLQTGQETLNIATRALSDAALTDDTDYLGFNDYADAIADFIRT